MKPILWLAVALNCIAVPMSAQAQDWQEVKGDHFIVYYLANETFTKQVARRAEFYYNQIASDLGYPRYSDFWQWDDRCKIYLYPNEEEFKRITGQPFWSHGMAHYAKRGKLPHANEFGHYAGVFVRAPEAAVQASVNSGKIAAVASNISN